MRFLLPLFFTLIISSYGFQVQINEETGVLEKTIPAFIGLGYHVLQGNPNANRIDQGFKAPIFKLTYEKGQMTEDGIYQIPDYTHSTQSTSCSVEAKTTEYSGTYNYQKQLSSITNIDTRLSISFLNAAFTFSKSFQQFINSTQTYKQTSSQSKSTCTLYTIDMPVYSNQISLSLDFIEGVKRAYADGDWKQFIQHFGTHFTSSVTYGGRYLLEHTYAEQSLSLFKSMKLDISMAAKIQYYQKIGIDLTTEMKRYINQTSIISSKVQMQRSSTLGGTPPKSGNWLDWVGTVKQNLAPVSYRLVTLSVLFNFIHSFDSAGAIKSFEGYLNSYCDRVACPPLTPQRPEPKPLEIAFSKTNQISGQLKNNRTYDTNDGNIKVAMRVYRVLMGSQGSIDSIQFFLSDGLSQHVLPVIGNRAFNHKYQVPKGDEIKCIRFGISYNSFNNSYWKFTSMQFITRRGLESEIFAGTYKINQYRVLCLQNDQQHFVGFFGRYGNTFDSVGLNIMKETMPKS